MSVSERVSSAESLGRSIGVDDICNELMTIGRLYRPTVTWVLLYPGTEEVETGSVLSNVLGTLKKGLQ